MIDTIVLTLQPDQFRIMDHNRFSPSTLGLFQAPYYGFGGRGNFKCVQNPTAKELEAGIYKPRLTVTKRPKPGGFTTTLKIEFSIPKMIFGNNFDEVEENHFEAIISRLYKTLYDMSVMVAPDLLRNAPVSAVHYSKNIVLRDYSTPSRIISEFAKIDLNQKLDLNQTDFRNGGHALKFHASSYEICLYDKIKDLKQAKTSEKRAIERDNALQLELFDQWKPKKPFEVLRMEIRLNKRAKIKQVFKEICVCNDLTFSSIFKSTISQKVLLLYFKQIKSGYAPLAYRPKTIVDFMADFKNNNPKTKIRKMLQMLALKMSIEQMGIRGFREATSLYGTHNWNRLKKDLETYHFPSNDYSILKPIETALLNFKPIKLKEFEKSVDRIK